MIELRAQREAWQQENPEQREQVRKFILENKLVHGVDHDLDFIWLLLTEEEHVMLTLLEPRLLEIFRRIQ